jgi:Na+-transporting NADH:ubiquinone oxidoreductase subunit C
MNWFTDRFDVPLMIVENGFGAYDKVEADGTVDDSYRIDYLGSHIKSMMDAVENDDINENNLPLYVAEVNGETKYIIPMTGNGLWGAIWGYIALNDDCNTIYGVYFSHASETPGLGAEIASDKFQNRFTKDKDGNAIVKKVYDENGKVALAVEKGKGVAGENYHIDAVSGATITCSGLQVMLESKLAPYYNYLKNQQK